MTREEVLHLEIKGRHKEIGVQMSDEIKSKLNKMEKLMDSIERFQKRLRVAKNNEDNLCMKLSTCSNRYNKLELDMKGIKNKKTQTYYKKEVRLKKYFEEIETLKHQIKAEKIDIENFSSAILTKTNSLEELNIHLINLETDEA